MLTKFIPIGLIPPPNSFSSDAYHAFLRAQNAPNPFSAESPRPGPAEGAYDAPPDLLVGWGGVIPLPLDLISASSAPRTVSRFSIIDLWSR